MLESSMPVLIIVIFWFLILHVLILYRLNKLNRSERNSVAALLIVLLAWGIYSGYLSSTGVYMSATFLQLSPGYWLPYVPVITVVTLTLIITPLRFGLRNLADYIPGYWLTVIHMLRILALGTIIKAALGVFPEKFAWFVGIPDLLFGLSAIPVTLLLHQKRLSEQYILLWHLTGALVIIAPAMAFMHILMEEALFPELFAYPMALAPTLVVPMFVMLNLMVVWRMLEKKLTAKSIRSNYL